MEAGSPKAAARGAPQGTEPSQAQLEAFWLFACALALGRRLDTPDDASKNWMPPKIHGGTADVSWSPLLQ